MKFDKLYEELVQEGKAIKARFGKLNPGSGIVTIKTPRPGKTKLLDIQKDFNLHVDIDPADPNGLIIWGDKRDLLLFLTNNDTYGLDMNAEEISAIYPELLRGGEYVVRGKELKEVLSAGKDEAAALKLIKQNADITLGNSSCLTLAAQAGFIKVVKVLVKKGIAPNNQNGEAIRQAAKKGHLDIVKYLVSAGANPHVSNKSALKWATKNGHDDIVEYLNSL